MAVGWVPTILGGFDVLLSQTFCVGRVTRLLAQCIWCSAVELIRADELHGV